MHFWNLAQVRNKYNKCFQHQYPQYAWPLFVKTANQCNTHWVWQCFNPHVLLAQPPWVHLTQIQIQIRKTQQGSLSSTPMGATKLPPWHIRLPRQSHPVIPIVRLFRHNLSILPICCTSDRKKHIKQRQRKCEISPPLRPFWNPSVAEKLST